MEWNFLIGPLVGAVIGYITNGIAIKMLFRPLNPVKIGRYTLPFTPGVIPKEKSRLAKSIGKVVSSQLLNEEVFKAALTKPEMIQLVENSIDNNLDKYKLDSRSLREVAETIYATDKIDCITTEVEDNMTFMIYSKVIDMELGKLIVNKVTTTLKEGALAQFLGPMSFLVKDGMIDNLGEKIEPAISQMIVNESEDIIKNAVQAESQKLQSKMVSEVANTTDKYKDDLKKAIIYMYKEAVGNSLNKTLEKLDIANMIEDKIMSFDTLEMERLILEIISKELKRLVWLGAFLGGIMGIIIGIF